ncbi:MAG: GxxExxY protein [Gemmatimonadaceae bacterium]
MSTHALIEHGLTGSVIGAFFEVYSELGFGFVEQPYVLALASELMERGHSVAREVSVPIYYKGERLCAHRIDLIVDERLILEVKSGQHLPPTATRQLYNYLRATDLEVGLILHFGPEPKFYRQIMTKDQKYRKEAPGT